MSKWLDSFAEVGRVSAWINVIAASLIGLVLLVFGVIMYKDNRGMVKTVGKVLDEVCQSSSTPSISNMCSFSIVYNVNGQALFGTVSAPRGKFLREQIIDVYYRHDDVHDINIDAESKKTIAIILIVAGCLLPAIALVHLYLTRKSELYAGAQGASAVWNAVI